MQLDDYIDQMWDADVPIRDLAYLLRILGQNARQLGGLLRDRKALSGEAADGICDALNRALNELSGELETTL
jgi:ABC-type transporter Mla subunit MlaD